MASFACLLSKFSFAVFRRIKIGVSFQLVVVDRGKEIAGCSWFTTASCQRQTCSFLSGEMSSFEYAFRGRHSQLQAKLSLNPLLSKLLDCHVLIGDQIDEIDHPMKTNAQKVECLLNKLEQRPDSDYPKFRQALEETNQAHILRDHTNVINDSALHSS